MGPITKIRHFDAQAASFAAASGYGRISHLIFKANDQKPMGLRFKALIMLAGVIIPWACIALAAARIR